MIKLMKQQKLLCLFAFWFFATTTALSAIINHDISTARLTISGTSTDDYVITGSTTANYVDVETGYQGSITLKNCTISLTGIAHSAIKIHGQNNQSNLLPLTNVKIVLDGNNRLYHYNFRGWAALQVDQGAQINISAINPYDNTSGILEAIVDTEFGGAAIGALADNVNETRGTAIESCYATTVPTAGGNIVISSGTITAKGGHGAGIGGGFYTYYDGIIVIYGGVVNSRAGVDAAGIGSGCPVGNGVSNCYTPNSAIIVLPPAQITAWGANYIYNSQVAELALAGSNNIVYIGDPAKPQITVHTEDFEPNANIYVDLSMNSSIASVITAIVPSNELDINKVKFGQTNTSGIYSFNGVLNDSTTFFTDANSSQTATLGRPYFPKKVTLPNGGTVILPLAMDLSFQVFPSTPLIEGFSTLEAFTNAYRVRLIYKDNEDMTNVEFDLANGSATYFAPMRFFKTGGTEIAAPNKFIKGDTIDIVIPIKDLSRASSYSDVLRIIGDVNGTSTGYIRQIVSQVVIKSLNETVCGSFFFKNEYLNQTGMYADTLQSTLGLDSIVILNLTAYPIYNDTLKVEFCHPDSVLFDGQYYSKTGFYTNAYTTIAGCDSILNLQLTVHLFNDTIYTKICGNDSILFGGKHYSIIGIYTDSLKSVFGCDSLSTLHLTLQPPFNDTIYTKICGNNSILFGGKYYSIQGIYTDSLKTVFGCDSLSTLHLTLQSSSNDTTYTQICDNDSILFGGKHYRIQGIYTDSLKTIFSCDSLSTLNLTVRRTFNDTIYAQICDDDSYLFSGVYYFNQGIYTNTYTTINGCDSLSTLHLTVHPTFNDTIYAEIYTNESVLFGGKYYSSQGIYTDSLKTIFGCDSLSTLHLTVHPTFDFRIIELNDICGDDFSFNIDFEELYGIVDYYSLAFDTKALAAGFSDVTMTPFTNPIIINLPLNVRPDNYKVNITLENTAKYKQEFTLDFMVRYPSSVMVQKWNDVVALYNSDYNGGYGFSAIQWYKNGNILSGETYSYLYLENSIFTAGDEYSALLTRSDDGESVFTCPLTVVVRALSTQVYPTMLSAGETINIISPKTAKVSIYNSLGVISNSQNIGEGNNTITNLNRPGFYFIIISDEEQVLHRQTIIVK